MAFFGLIGSTAKLAAQYEGRESATDRAARKDNERSTRRRHRYHHGGADRSARKGQAWSDKQR
jgi:hypothetical protein